MNERTAILSRMFVVFGLILLLPALIVLQLLRINFTEGDNLRELGNQQSVSTITVPAQRGVIYDSNGSLLAANSVEYKLAVDPRFPDITSQDITNLSRTLATHTGRPSNYYLEKVRNAPVHSRYVVLERSVDVTVNDAIKELDIPGVIFEEEYKRNYSFGTLAAHSLGYVNHAMTGMTGLENSYNDILKGRDGEQQVRRDRLNNIFAYVGATRKEPEQGHSLHTTINSFIQAILEEELESGIHSTGATYGTGIVVEPETGAIRALANFPTFDPNSPGLNDENRRNYAVADMIEPGSTFKLVTAIAAIEQGVVSLDEVFETPDSGVRMIHGQAMRDHDPLGTLTFTEAFAQSSNIAVSEMAMRLTPEVYYQYARNMGFGSLSYVDLPNEEPGRLQKPFEWSLVTLPWMSIGYEVQTTPLQLLMAYAAFANDGMLMRPYIVDRITDEFGKTVQHNEAMEVRRIANRKTIETLLPVFEEVVTDSGTAGWAAVEGLKIAGKTGTAQKYIDGSYQQRKYRASFTGFFPSDNPKYAIIIVLDEPTSSIYGGFTAGKIFRETAIRIAGLDSEIRQYLTPGAPEVSREEWAAVAPSVVGMKVDNADLLLTNQKILYTTRGSGDYIVSQTPEAGAGIPLGEHLEISLGEASTDSIPEGFVRIPNLRNMSMRQATAIVSDLGLNIEITGSGTIYNQFPLEGELMRPGRTVTVRGLARSLQQSDASITATN